MKKTISISITLLFLCSFITYAQKGKLTPEKQPISSRKILKDNLIAIKSAIYAIKTNKKKEDSDTPYLAYAVDYQLKALELYEKNNHEAAIYHALKSRKYALLEIKQNKGKIEETHRVMFGQLFKYFEKDETFYEDLKDELYDYDKPDMPSIDSYLISNIAVTKSNPDVNNPTEIKDLEIKCRLN